MTQDIGNGGRDADKEAKFYHPLLLGAVAERADGPVRIAYTANQLRKIADLMDHLEENETPAQPAFSYSNPGSWGRMNADLRIHTNTDPRIFVRIDLTHPTTPRAYFENLTLSDHTPCCGGGR